MMNIVIRLYFVHSILVQINTITMNTTLTSVSTMRSEKLKIHNLNQCSGAGSVGFILFLGLLDPHPDP
jgi:hypothetical protein